MPEPGESGEARSVVSLEGVTVMYGKQAALKDISSSAIIWRSGDVDAEPAGANRIATIVVPAEILRPQRYVIELTGAGKSSMIKALLGLVAPDRGRMHVLGLDVAKSPLEIRSRVGYMPESDAHIPGMNAVSFVAYCGELAGLPRIDAMQRAHEVLFYVGLGEARYRNVDTYSTGMKQRIKLAQALVHDPDLVFLDEPTNGMDPKGRDEMLELVRDLAQAKGISVIVSSHLLPDIEFTCRHIVVMDKGRVAKDGTIEGMKQPRGQVFELRFKPPAPPAGAAETNPFDAFVERMRAAGLECHATEDDVMRVFVPGEGSSREIFRLADEANVQVRHLRPSVPTLEDVFAQAIGEQ